MSTTQAFQPGNEVTRLVGTGLTVREKRLCEGQNDNTIREAVLNSARVVGVPSTTQSSPDPDESLSADPTKPGRVTVKKGMILPLMYSTAANFGDPLICTGNGEVGVVGAQANPNIVGYCEKTIAAAGEGLAYVNAGR